MATITFTTQSILGAIVNVISTPQKAKLIQLGGNKRGVTFPYGPQGISYNDIGLEYSTIDRPGLKPVLLPTLQKKRTISITAFLATPEDFGKSSVESILDVLGAIASENEDCAFTYGVVTLPYKVRLTDFSYTAIRRNPDGNITQAEITLQIDERVIFSQSIVALKAIAYPPDAQPSSSSKTTTAGPAPPPPPPPPPPAPDLGDWIDHTPGEIRAPVSSPTPD